MNSQNFLQNLTLWFFVHGIKVVVILIAAYLIGRFLRIFIEKIVERKIKDGKGEKKREKTLISVFGGTAKFLIWITVFLMILTEFGVKVSAILTGLGLASLGIGVAAKDMISDFIAGIFIILEDQYRIGDEIKIVGIEGKVKELTLRRTIIEDEKGFIHSVPNNQIKLVSKRVK